jgi:hypothetical protein
MVSEPIYFYTHYSTFSRFIVEIRGRPCVDPKKATPLEGLGCCGRLILQVNFGSED